MDLYSQKGKSTQQKIVIILLEIIILAISYWILFLGGYHQLIHNRSTGGDATRHLIMFIFNVIVFVRVCITMFYLLKRRIPWEEAFSIPFAFAIYYVGFALLGYATDNPVNFITIIAIVLFLLGSFLNTGSELVRNKWKKRKEHDGKLYTSGLFKYAMHINYFGDFLWVCAYAIITRNVYSIAIPIFIFCFFVFYNIPKLDGYLASRYGEEFEVYRKKTKKFIPFIY